METADYNISPAAAAAIGATVGVALGVAGTVATRRMHSTEGEVEAPEPAPTDEEASEAPET